MFSRNYFENAACFRKWPICGFVVIWILLFCRLESPAVDSADVLRLFYWQAPTIFNPHLNPSAKDLEACRITYEPLATVMADGMLLPILAAEIPSIANGGLAPDGAWVVWKLKPGVRWSDGRPFTADDVRFTWEFIRNPANKAVTASMYRSITSIEIPDDLIVKLNFESPNPAWTVPFVGADGMILPRHIFEKHAAADTDSPTEEPSYRLAGVGTGPFFMSGLKVEDMIMVSDDVVKMVNIQYTANPFFRKKGKPHFERLELTGGLDAETAARMVLMEGAADFAWNLQLSAERLKEIQKTGNGRVVYLEGPYVERILLNFTDPNRQTKTGEQASLDFPHPFFSDIRVRQAFAHAIDRDAIAALYGNTASVTTNILVSPTRYRSTDTIHMYPFNLKRAAELLDQAGWEDHDGDGFRDKNNVSLRVLFQTSLNPIRQKTQEIVKTNLRTIGVDVRLKVVDAGVFFGNNPSNDSNFHKFYADMQEYTHMNSIPDPTYYMAAWTCDQAAQQSNNWSHRNLARWCHPGYDALYRRVRVEFDLEKRREYFIRMNNLLVEEVVMIPLVKRATPFGVSAQLRGIRLTPWDRATWNIEDWHRE